MDMIYALHSSFSQPQVCIRIYLMSFTIYSLVINGLPFYIRAIRGFYSNDPHRSTFRDQMLGIHNCVYKFDQILKYDGNSCSMIVKRIL